MKLVRMVFSDLGGSNPAALPAAMPDVYKRQVQQWGSLKGFPAPSSCQCASGGGRPQIRGPKRRQRSGRQGRGPATAEDTANKLGMEYNKEDLTNPEINIKLGTKYFSTLYELSLIHI